MNERSTMTDYLASHAFIDDFALAYHVSVAEALRRDPERILAEARATLDRWIGGGAFDESEMRALVEWRHLLGEAPVDALRGVITDPSERGVRLRQSSPFAGVLPERERRALLRACEERARHLADATR